MTAATITDAETMCAIQPKRIYEASEMSASVFAEYAAWQYRTTYSAAWHPAPPDMCQEIYLVEGTQWRPWSPRQELAQLHELLGAPSHEVALLRLQGLLASEERPLERAASQRLAQLAEAARVMQSARESLEALLSLLEGLTGDKQ